MKKINIFLSIMAALFVFGACSKDDDKYIEVKVPAGVTNVNATEDYGSVGFTWSNPTEADFSYVKISYVNHVGAITSVDAAAGAESAIVAGFAKSKAYVFNLTAIDKDGNKSEPSSVSATPNTPAYQLIAETIKAELVNEEVVVEWTNETAKKVTLVVQYTDGQGEAQNIEVDASQTGTMSIADMTAENPTVFIYAMDDYENETEPQEFVIKFINEEMLSTANWTVHDFSSEEPAEGGGNGLVTAAFDGDLNTFWHSDWANLAPVYPHYFSINMGKTNKVIAFECSTRQYDDRGATKIQFLGSSDGENWTDLGTFDFDPNINDAQRFDVTSTDMQYFKYMALEGMDTFTFLAEINVYVTK